MRQIQNGNGAKLYMDEILGYVSMAYVGEYAYCADFFFNGIFRINTITHMAEFLSFLDGNNTWETRLIRKVLCRDGFIIALPFRSKGIYEYNIESQKTDRIYDCNLFGEGFSNAIRINDGILLVPLYINEKFIMYKDNRSIYSMDEINKKVAEIIDD